MLHISVKIFCLLGWEFEQMLQKNPNRTYVENEFRIYIIYYYYYSSSLFYLYLRRYIWNISFIYLLHIYTCFNMHLRHAIWLLDTFMCYEGDTY